jgi:hypothetical protein
MSRVTRARTPGLAWRAALRAALGLAWAACGSSAPTSVDARGESAVPADGRPDAPVTADAATVSPDAATLEGPSSDAAAPSDGSLDAGADGAGADVAVAAGDAPADGSGDTAGGPHWVALQAPIGAAIGAITMDDDGILYAGGWARAFAGPSSGVFASPDEGASWHPVNNGVIDFHVAGLFASGKVIYAGTSGLLRSEDRGASWVRKPPSSTVGHVGVIGAQGDLVVVGSDYGGDALWVSSNAGETFHELPDSAEVSTVAVLGTVILRAGTSGVLRSTDLGVTFQSVQGITNGFGMDANLRCDGLMTCYASAHVGGGPLDPPVILESTDAGVSWASTGKASLQVLAVSDTGIVYITDNAAMAGSDDGGATWTPVQRPTTREAFQPDCGGPLLARGSKLYAACNDGVYRSDDRGGHWSWAGGSPATGAITGYAGGAMVDTTATALGPDGDLYTAAAGSTRSHLLRSSDDGATWQDVISPFIGSNCLVTGGGALECTTFSSNAASAVLRRSEDHGATWKEVLANPMGTPADQAVNPSVLAKRGSVVFAAGNGVARSDDDGLTFHPVSLTPRYVTSLQVLRSGHVLAGTGQGMVERSSDGGITWTALTARYDLPVFEDGAGRILAPSFGGGLAASTDEGDTWSPVPNTNLPTVTGTLPQALTDGADRMFVLVSSSEGITISASTDHGATWGPLPAPLPNPNVLTFLSDKKGRLIAATSGGIYRLGE